MGKDKEIAFEEAMEKLESISSKLAEEKVSLDDAISLYEEGVVYYNTCMDKLNDANRRIMVIEENARKNND